MHPLYKMLPNQSRMTKNTDKGSGALTDRYQHIPGSLLHFLLKHLWFSGSRYNLQQLKTRTRERTEAEFDKVSVHIALEFY